MKNLKKKKPIKKVGRPQKSINWNLVESLSILDAKEEFIAERLLLELGEDVNKKSIVAKVKHIQRKIKERFDMNFVQYRQQKFEGTKIRLRQIQLKLAETSAAMAIFLGKNYLGQVNEQTIVHSGSIENKIRNMDQETRENRIKELESKLANR